MTSPNQGLPVGVVRGAGGDRAHSPATGYRYDGLFRVAGHWSETGRSGYRIFVPLAFDTNEQAAAIQDLTLAAPKPQEEPDANSAGIK